MAKKKKKDKTKNDPAAGPFTETLPEIQQLITSFLDDKSAAALASTSTSLFSVTKDYAAWRDKIIAAGFPAELIDRFSRKGIINNYRKFYFDIIKLKKCNSEDSHAPVLCEILNELLFNEAGLICLSGNQDAIKQYLDSLDDEKRKRVVPVLALLGHVQSIRAFPNLIFPYIGAASADTLQAVLNIVGGGTSRWLMMERI